MYCGGDFEVHKYRLLQGLGKYCSHSCRAKACILPGEKHPRWKGKIATQCEECGKEMSVSPWRLEYGGGRYCSLSCRAKSNYRQGKLRKQGHIKRPTKPEIALNGILEVNKLPFKLVGDGEVWLGNRNPDFINIDGKKQVIEVFGTYWHPIFDVAQRVEHYKQYGFDCLVIWEDEFRNPDRVLAKVKKFAKMK